METIISSRLAALRAKQIISLQGSHTPSAAVVLSDLARAKDLAAVAKHAAGLVRKRGRFAMARYCQKRGVPAELFILALRLENVK